MTGRSAGPLRKDIYTSQTKRVRFTSMLFQGNRILIIKKKNTDVATRKFIAFFKFTELLQFVHIAYLQA